jgi:hypothetical protein
MKSNTCNTASNFRSIYHISKIKKKAGKPKSGFPAFANPQNEGLAYFATVGIILGSPLAGFSAACLVEDWLPSNGRIR